MSEEKPHVTTVELVFRDSDGQMINAPLFFKASPPIPLVGEEVTFYGDRFKIVSRQFSYEKQLTDIRVLLICEKIARPAPQFILTFRMSEAVRAFEAAIEVGERLSVQTGRSMATFANA